MTADDRQATRPALEYTEDRTLRYTENGTTYTGREAFRRAMLAVAQDFARDTDR